MKKFLSLFVVLLLVFVVTGCTSKSVKGSLTEIMDELYNDIPSEKLPMMLETHELTKDQFEYYAFVKDVDYKEAVFSESMTGSTAHSVVLIRLNDASDAANVVNEIKKNANPRKWICVEASNVYVESKGDLVVLIMADEIANDIKMNFEKLK